MVLTPKSLFVYIRSIPLVLKCLILYWVMEIYPHDVPPRKKTSHLNSWCFYTLCVYKCKRLLRVEVIFFKFFVFFVFILFFVFCESKFKMSLRVRVIILSFSGTPSPERLS